MNWETRRRALDSNGRTIRACLKNGGKAIFDHFSAMYLWDPYRTGFSIARAIRLLDRYPLVRSPLEL